MMISGFLSTLLLLTAALLISALLAGRSRTVFFLYLYTLLYSFIIAGGYILSYFDQLAHTSAWALLSFTVLCFTILIVMIAGKGRVIMVSFQQMFKIPNRAALLQRFTSFEKLLFTPLILTTIVLGFVSLFLVINLAPGNWDSMASYMARVGYFIQHGNLDNFSTHSWAHVVHPRNSTILHLYALVNSGNENLVQMMQYLAYWASGLSIYGIASLLGLTRKESLFSALISLLLVSWVMQASTTQNDLLITSFVGISTYLFLLFHKKRTLSILNIATLALVIPLGMKGSALLALIPVGIVGLYSFTDTSYRIVWKHFWAGGAFTMVWMIIFVLPSGYINNIQQYGHPLGPELVMSEHTYDNASIRYIATNGVRNMLRYSVEFISLDGLPPIKTVRSAQHFLRGTSSTNQDDENSRQLLPLTSNSNSLSTVLNEPATTDKLLHSEWFAAFLSASEAARVPYQIQKIPTSSEDSSYWGPLGIFLILPLQFLLLFYRKTPTVIRFFILLSLLFMVLQSFSGPYDPWRGRYFNILAIFTLPQIGMILRLKYRWIQGYLFLIVLLGCLAAGTGLLLESNSRIINYSSPERGIYYESLIQKDRSAQISRMNSRYGDAIRNFDNLVPIDASVAIFLYPGYYEYPFFGEKISRSLFPIYSFTDGLQPVPDNADYLMYHMDYPCADYEEDTHLGMDLFLRKVESDNRHCDKEMPEIRRYFEPYEPKL